MSNALATQDLKRDARGDYHRPDGTFANRYEIAAYAYRTGTLTEEMTISWEIVAQAARMNHTYRSAAYVATHASANAARHAGYVLRGTVIELDKTTKREQRNANTNRLLFG